MQRQTDRLAETNTVAEIDRRTETNTLAETD